MDERRAAAEWICAVLRTHGHRALLAGGCVRDMLLGHEAKDYDVATDARPERVESLFEKTVSVGAAFGVVLVILPQGQFEVTTFRRAGPYLDGRHPSRVDFLDERQDAERRDFTINALFFDPESHEIVDYVGGREDLKAGLVRTVGDPRLRFTEDHLRLLRAVRFTARLGFALDANTRDALVELAPMIHTVSAERVRDELLKMLTEGNAKTALQMLDETGLLQHVLPEIAAMKGVEQPAEFHPEGDVFVHTLLLLDHIRDATPTLALGALLHDVGKPVTATFSDRIRFNNHDKIGAEMAGEICRRLRMSNRETERVVWLVDQHMRLAHAPQMRESKLKRFVREEGFRELLELGLIDCLASHGDLSTIQWIEDYLEQHPAEECRPQPLLTGRDLIALGYGPGPVFREMLTAIEDAQLEGLVQTREEAINLIRERWPNT
ncbi:MAG: CCA tRNA nucleotidyltransferase [Candidatus Hydrogenedentes bacterium]|nr:CCA tRNA nucleotidyltransferase [Candidatus Hydrogenedentota bacterium]